MKRLPDPAYVSFETNVTARGINVAKPCDRGKIQWHFGLAAQKPPQLTWHAIYASANVSEVIRTEDGDICRGPAETFDRPTWRDAYAWIRYGIMSETSNSAPKTGTSPTPPPAFKTIADVSVIAPGAYWVTDGGAQRCPSGSPGHALHFAARFDPANHTLKDAVVETKSMRICMIRFDLGSYQSVGTGYQGDMQLDFGNVAGNWIITRGHAAFALRMVGLSLKTAVIDFWYTNVAFPTIASGV